MKKGGWGLIVSYWLINIGCENFVVIRDGVSLVVDWFLIFELVVFYVEFFVWFRYEDIISG